MHITYAINIIWVYSEREKMFQNMDADAMWKRNAIP